MLLHIQTTLPGGPALKLIQPASNSDWQTALADSIAVQIVSNQLYYSFAITKRER
jgi:hypothetical protein